MKHNRIFAGSWSLGKKFGFISVVFAIVAIGLVFVSQSTQAGKNALTQSQAAGFSFDNTVSGPAASMIRPADDADVSPSEIRNKTFERLGVAAAKSDDGMIHAIVGVNAEFRPVGDLSDDQAERQSDGIKKAQSDVIARLKSGRVTVLHEFEFLPFMLVDVDEAGLTGLQNDAGVLTVEEDLLAVSHLAESSPVVSAPAAWTAGFDGTGWEVAVLDTGVNKHHDFFGVGPPTKIVSEACYSNTEPASGASSLCPGGATSSTAVDSGMNCTGFAGCEHGTHAAGVVAGNNGTNGSGVGRGANIIAMQVFRAYTAAACGGESPCTKTATSDQLRALERVLFLTTPGGGSRRIAAVNMSLGGLPLFTTNTQCDAANASRKAAIDNLRSVGVATVVSSGNDGNIFGITAPACISTAVSVGSTVDSGIDLDGVSSFSNSSFDLSLLAPGDTITSSSGFGNPSNVFTGLSGTSFAAPHVAGAFAVLRQAAPNLPNATSVGSILNALRTTGKPVRDFRNGVLTPRINVDGARRLLQGLPPPPPPPTPTPTPTPPVVTCVVAGVLGTAPAGGTTGNLEGRPPGTFNATPCGQVSTSYFPFGAPAPHIYNAHRFANTTASPVCVTVTLIHNVAGTAPSELMLTAQIAPFVPSELGNEGRFLGQGRLNTGTPPVPLSFSATVAANTSFDVVVNSFNPSPAGQGAQYTLTVSGLPSCPAGVPVATPTPIPTPTPTPTPTPFGIPAILFQDATGEEGPPGSRPSLSPSGGATIDFPITLSAPSDQIVTALVSTNGITATEEGDFVGLEEIEVVFPPFTTTRTISVTTIEDPGDEPDETFSLDLIAVSNASVGDGQGIGTIVDDDPAPSITIDNVTHNEGNAGTTAYTFSVSVDRPSAAPVTVQYATADGTAEDGNPGAPAVTEDNDYVAKSGTLTFTSNGPLVQTVTVLVNGDAKFEPNEVFFLTLSNPVNGNIVEGGGVGLVLNDDLPPGFAVSNVSAAEGNTGTTPFAFDITRGGNDTVLASTVTYSTTAGTAVAPDDFASITGGTVTFAPGETSKTVVVSVVGDPFVEPTETFTLNIVSATNGTITDGSGLGTIVNDDGVLGGLEGDIVDANGGPAGGDGVKANDVTVISQKVLFPATSPPFTLNQFQRSDVNAPCGNGGNDAGDVTVIAQMALNLLAPLPACGPLAPIIVPSRPETADTVGRIIRAVSTNGVAGQTVTVPFILESQGNEASISYTITFPQATLSNPQVALGSGVPSGTTFGLNTSQVAQGRLGVLVATANTYAAGTRQMITVTFNIAAGATPGNYPVGFSSTPVGQSVSAAQGGAIFTDVTYEPGNVVLGATAAGVEVSGRITTPDGRGLRNATVTITDSEGNRRTAITGSFGTYRFEDVGAGESYVVAVTSRRYRFTSRVLNVTDSLSDVDFVGQD